MAEDSQKLNQALSTGFAAIDLANAFFSILSREEEQKLFVFNCKNLCLAPGLCSVFCLLQDLDCLDVLLNIRLVYYLMTHFYHIGVE